MASAPKAARQKAPRARKGRQQAKEAAEQAPPASRSSEGGGEEAPEVQSKEAQPRQPEPEMQSGEALPPAGMSLAYERLDGLQRAKRNPRRHDIDSLKDSFRRFGVANVVAAVNDAAGTMYAGHGRLEALTEMQAKGEAAPARVQVAPDGGWLVPVLHGVTFKNEVEAEAYLVADNKLTEVATWNEVEFAPMLADIMETEQGLSGLGMDSGDVEDIQRLATGQDARAGDIDPAAEWEGMPGFEHEQVGFRKLIIHFRNKEAVEEFCRRLDYLNLSDRAKYKWFPDEAFEAEGGRAYTTGGKAGQESEGSDAGVEGVEGQ
jgi:hypothetical protein